MDPLPSPPVLINFRRWLFGKHTTGEPFEEWRAAVLALDEGDRGPLEKLPLWDRCYLEGELAKERSEKG